MHGRMAYTLVSSFKCIICRASGVAHLEVSIASSASWFCFHLKLLCILTVKRSKQFQQGTRTTELWTINLCNSKILNLLIYRILSKNSSLSIRHPLEARSTQRQLLTELLRRQPWDKSVRERLLMEAEVVVLWRDGGQPWHGPFS